MDRCDRLLAFGVFNTTKISSSTEVKLTWRKWWFSLSEGEAKDASSLGISLPFELPVKGSFDTDSFRKWKQQNAGELSGSAWSRSDFELLQRQADPNLLSAYNRCVQTTETGFQMWADVVDPDDILFTMKFTPVGDQAARPVVVASSIVNGRSLFPNTNAGELLPAGLALPYGPVPVLVKRPDVKETTSCTIWTSEGSQSIVCAPWENTTRPEIRPEITVPAKAFSRSTNIQVGVLPYGDDVIHNAPPYRAAPNMAEYDIMIPSQGRYYLDITYAALVSRPTVLSINGVVVKSDATKLPTGGWELGRQNRQREGVFELRPGINQIRLSRSDVFPHIRELSLSPTA